MFYDEDRKKWVPGWLKKLHAIRYQTDPATNVFIGKKK